MTSRTIWHIPFFQFTIFSNHVVCFRSFKVQNHGNMVQIVNNITFFLTREIYLRKEKTKHFKVLFICLQFKKIRKKPSFYLSSLISGRLKHQYNTYNIWKIFGLKQTIFRLRLRLIHALCFFFHCLINCFYICIRLNTRLKVSIRIVNR